MIEFNGKSSKDVFALRKGGKLDEALTLSRNLHNAAPMDEWIIRAYSWTLISLIWENRDNDEGLKFATELKKMPAIEDDVLIEQRGKALSVADPISREINKVISLSKDGKHTAALKTIQNLREQHGGHAEIDKTYGWELWHAVRLELYGDNKPNEEQLQNYFHEYGHLGIEKPSDIHSRMLDIASRAASKDVFSTFVGFLLWWDPENIRNDDFVRNPMEDGGQFDSLVEHVIKALGHLSKQNMPDNHLKLAENFISKHYTQFPDQDWFPYYLSLYMNRTGKNTEALDLLIPIARKKSNEFWAWSHLSDCFPEDQDKRISCLCRAVQCRVEDETFLINVHLVLAEELIRLGEKAIAKHHIEKVRDIRTLKEWPIRGRLEELLNESWFEEVESSEGVKYVSKLASNADEILLKGLPKYPAVVAVPLKKIGKKENDYAIVDFLKGTESLSSTLVSHKKFPFVKELQVGDPLEVIVEQHDDKIMVISASTRDGEPFDVLPQKNGIVSHVNKNKSTIMAKLDDGGKAFLYFDEIEGANSLEEGTFINCRIASDRGKTKIRSFSLLDTVPDSDFWKTFSGYFRAREQGGGHVDNLFIPAHLAKGIEAGDIISGISVQRDGDRNENWWCAVKISNIEKGSKPLSENAEIIDEGAPA
jgi:hypothetical protein